MKLIASQNTLFTDWSTPRVSQLVTGRGTMSVPVTLYQVVRTSTAPAAPATIRAASGTTISTPDDQRLARTYPRSPEPDPAGRGDAAGRRWRPGCERPACARSSHVPAGYLMGMRSDDGPVRAGRRPVPGSG